MAINWKNVFSFGGGVVAHEIAEQALNLMLGQVGKHGADYIKGNILGLGTDDEVLFNSALTYCAFGLNISPVEIVRVLDVFATYPRASRRRIVQIIGKDEREEIIKLPAVDSRGNILYDKDGNIVYKDKKIVANVKGAETIALMSKLDEAGIKRIIETSNMTSPLGDKMAEMFEPANLKAAVQNVKSGYDQIGGQLNGGNTMLDRWAQKLRK